MEASVVRKRPMHLRMINDTTFRGIINHIMIRDSACPYRNQTDASRTPSGARKKFTRGLANGGVRSFLRPRREQNDGRAAKPH